MNRNRFDPNMQRQFREHDPAGRVIFGIVIALIGVAFFLKTLGILPFALRFSWPVILIVVGFLIGLKNGFRNNAWWILMAVGIANVIPQFYIMGKPSRHFVWPLFVIAMGVMIALRPRRSKRYCRKQMKGPVVITDENKLFIDVSFGGRKEIVTSKDFRGGAIFVSFGGSEVNLTQADFTTPEVELDCRVSFGSVELIVPSNWEIVNEIRPSFGNVEDERVIYANTTGETRKRLILRGTCSFGSIEIKSY